MIKPNRMLNSASTIHGLQVSTAYGLVLCAVVFLGLLLGKKTDLKTVTLATLPFAIGTGFFTGKNYKDFVIGLRVHPHYLYSETERNKRFFEE